MSYDLKSTFFMLLGTLFCLSMLTTDAMAKGGSLAAVHALGIYSVSTSGTTTSGVTTTVGVVWILAPQRAENTIQDYLKRNRRAVHQAIALGGGPTMVELAHMFGVKKTHHAHFAHMLRQERHILLKTLAPDVPNAKTFISHIKGKMLAHAKLRLSIPARHR